jgi:hypothetical protein
LHCIDSGGLLQAMILKSLLFCFLLVVMLGVGSCLGWYFGFRDGATIVYVENAMVLICLNP